MAGYEDEMTSPFSNLGSLSALLTEAVQRAVGAEDRERALRSELEQTRAQLAAVEEQNSYDQGGPRDFDPLRQR